MGVPCGADCRLLAAEKADRKQSRKSVADAGQKQDLTKRVSVHGPKLLDQSQILKRSSGSQGSATSPSRKSTLTHPTPPRKSQVAPEPSGQTTTENQSKNEAKHGHNSSPTKQCSTLAMKKERSLSKISPYRVPAKLKGILVIRAGEGDVVPKKRRKRKHVRFYIPKKPEDMFMVHPDSKENYVWMWVHFCMIELQFYLIPYFSAFQYESAFNWPLDSLELLYIVDLIKKLFVTGYFDEDGKLECNWRKIAARTLKTLNFWWEVSGLMFYGTTLILHELTPRPFEPQSPILVANLASRMFRVTRMRYIFAFFRKRELNFQLKATGPTVTKFFMVMTGYILWAGCLYYLLSELVIRFNIIDGDPTVEDVTWRDCPSCAQVKDIGFLYVFYWAANTLTSTGYVHHILASGWASKCQPGATFRHSGLVSGMAISCR